jgi:hypothetical protein
VTLDRKKSEEMHSTVLKQKKIIFWPADALRGSDAEEIKCGVYKRHAILKAWIWIKHKLILQDTYSSN